MNTFSELYSKNVFMEDVLWNREGSATLLLLLMLLVPALALLLLFGLQPCSLGFSVRSTKTLKSGLDGSLLNNSVERFPLAAPPAVRSALRRRLMG